MSISYLLRKSALAPALLFLTISLWLNSALAEEVSDDGRHLVTNAAGQVTLMLSPEEWVWSDALNYIGRGYATNALAKCDSILATNAMDRWARLARMEVYVALGDSTKSEQDFDYLTVHYPNFLQIYNIRLNLLLKKSESETGKHILVEWLHSPNEHKSRAAEDLVAFLLKSINDHSKDWLNSTDEKTQKDAEEILRLGYEAEFRAARLKLGVEK